MGSRSFTVIQGDDVEQPFRVPSIGGAPPTGDENWRLTIRKAKTGEALVELRSPEAFGIRIETATKQPTAIFRPETLDRENFPPSDVDVEYWYDLESERGGRFSTHVIDRVRVVTDISR